MKSADEKYVYGIALPEMPLPRCRGIAGRAVTLLDGGEVAAIVSDVSPPVRAGREELSTHARVLQRVLAAGPVLPMRFGVVMPDQEVVREELLDPFQEDLVEQLHELSGTVELHLRASYEEPALMSEVVAADPQIAALSRRLRGQSRDATYYAQIELGQRVAERAAAAAAADREAILSELEPLCVAVSVGEEQHERIACDAAFLVEEPALERFDRAVDELGRRNHGRLRFSYTGPHPPYNFVELPARA